MKNETCDRIWIKAERGLSFNDIREALPNITLEHGVYGVHDDITKVTIYQNFYKQTKIAEIFFDEKEGRFLFGEKYDDKLCTELGKLYGFYTLTLGYMKSLNPNLTFGNMLLALTEDMRNFIKHNAIETNH